MVKGEKPVQEPEEEEEQEEEEEEMGDVVEEFLNSLPADIRSRVEHLLTLNDSAEEIDVEYKKERAALEKKFFEKKAALWAQRSEVVSGAKEVVEDKSTVSSKGIPGFWLQRLTNSAVISQIITDEDMPALKHLSDIKVEYTDDYKSFSLHFHFDENEYFTNKVLTKTYTVDPDLLDEKPPSLLDAQRTEIEWKPGMNLCATEIKKKQRAKSGKNKGQTRIVTQSVPKPSFFHYFSAPLSEEDDEDRDDEERDEEAQIKLTTDEDFDISHTIRTTIVPDAVLWFTGELSDDMDDFDFDEDENEEGEGDDDEDDDEDDDDDDEDEAPAKPAPKGKGKNAPKAGQGFAAPQGGQPGGNNPECKQN